MKRKIILSATFLTLCFTSFLAQAQRGQENNTPESKANKLATQLQGKLGLNDDQKAKVAELNLNTIKETRALKVEKRNDLSGLQEGYVGIHKEYDKGIKGILTTDQYTNWKKFQMDARAKKQKELQDQSGRRQAFKTNENKKFNPDEEDPEEEMTWEEASE